MNHLYSGKKAPIGAEDVQWLKTPESLVKGCDQYEQDFRLRRPGGTIFSVPAGHHAINTTVPMHQDVEFKNTSQQLNAKATIPPADVYFFNRKQGNAMSWLDVKWFLEDAYDSVADAVSDGFDVVGNTVSDGIDAVTDFIDENPKTSIAIGVIAGIATAGVAAPAIAAAIGTTGALGATAGGTVIASLEGAALSSASLAALGGGSLAAGGAGMAGGTCVVAAGGGVLAGGVSAGGVVTTKKLKS